MTESKKYRLYLRYNTEDDNYYSVGVLYGKVPLDDTIERNFYGDFKSDHIKGIIEKLKKTYTNGLK